VDADKLRYLSPSEREAWERSQKATEGPWATDTFSHRSRTEVGLVLLDAEGKRLSDTLNADDVTIHEEPDEDSVYFYVSGPSVDALEFAAHARTDLPTALTSLAETRAVLARCELHIKSECIAADYTPSSVDKLLKEIARLLHPVADVAREKL
jgi:hypothetical protein